MHVLFVTNSELPFSDPPVSCLGEVRRKTEYEAVTLGALQIDEDLVVLVRPGWDDDGASIVRALRRAAAPLLLVIGPSDAAARVEALESGADDVLEVPFAPAEFLARARALVRRTPRLRYGSFDVDVARREARLDGQRLALSVREFDLLLVLIQRAGEAATRVDLTPRERVERGRPRAARSSNCRRRDRSSNWLEVYVNRLRRKLGKHARLLRTIPGVGYALDRPASRSSAPQTSRSDG